jgi:hypothetical protein
VPLRIADSTEGATGVGAGVELLMKGLVVRNDAKAAKELCEDMVVRKQEGLTHDLLITIITL